MTRSAGAMPASCPPRGLRREAAAGYVGVSVTKFDEWVTKGVMPQPKRVDKCVIWDRHQLDDAFEHLSDAPVAGSDWDEALNTWPRSA